MDELSRMEITKEKQMNLKIDQKKLSDMKIGRKNTNKTSGPVRR